MCHLSPRHFHDNHLIVQHKGKKGTHSSMSHICLKPGDASLSGLPLVLYPLPPGNNQSAPEDIEDKDNQHTDAKVQDWMRVTARSQPLGVQRSSREVGHIRRLLWLGETSAFWNGFPVSGISVIACLFWKGYLLSHG